MLWGSSVWDMTSVLQFLMLIHLQRFQKLSANVVDHRSAAAASCLEQIVFLQPCIKSTKALFEALIK